MKITTKKLAISALLLAADVILTRILAINTPLMKVGFGFLAVAVCAAYYGPWWAALVAALADIVGSLIFPTGAYFPGFTLTAAVTGLIFGYFLHRRSLEARYGIHAAVLNSILVTFVLNSAMISYISGTPFFTLLKVRAVQLLIMLPLQCLVLVLILPGIVKKTERFT